MFFYLKEVPQSVPWPIEQPCSIIFAKVPRKIVWNFKNGQKKHILYFKVVVFSRKVTLDSQIAILARLPKLFCQKSEMFLLKIWKPKTFLYFSPEKGASKRSHGHVECIFDNSAKIFFPKSPHSSYESETKLFFLKMFHWTPRLHFDKLARKFLPIHGKVFEEKVPKCWKE